MMSGGDGKNPESTVESVISYLRENNKKYTEQKIFKHRQGLDLDSGNELSAVRGIQKEVKFEADTERNNKRIETAIKQTSEQYEVVQVEKRPIELPLLDLKTNTLIINKPPKINPNPILVKSDMYDGLRTVIGNQAVVVRAHGNAFNENQKLDQVLTSGVVEPHVRGTIEKESLSEQIHQHNSKEEGGVAEMISFTDPTYQSTVHHYANRQYSYGIKYSHSTNPFVLACFGNGMAGKDTEGKDKDWGFSNFTAVGPQPVVGLRPWVPGTLGGAVPGTVIFVQKNLPKQEKAAVIEALLRFDETTGNHSSVKCQ